MTAKINWTVIDQIGEALGVGYRARQKWRQRNHIPHKYRLQIVIRTRGAIGAEDFLAMDRENGKVAAKKISKKRG